MSNKKIVLDTDILIDYLRGLKPAIQFFNPLLNHNEIFVSVITHAELFAGARQEEIETISNFLSAFKCIDMNPNIAFRGGLYRRDYFKSHGTGLADALIAASVIQINALFVTLNKKHFPMLEQVLVPYQK